MKAILKKITPSFIKKLILSIRYDFLDGYAIKSYSQEGEDMILKRIFENQGAGFYVDIGAHHPKRFSNTYYFYNKGWKGINIDAMPGSMKLFNKFRPRDINMEMGISSQKGTQTFFIFNEPALNSFDEKLSTYRLDNTSYKLVDRKLVQVDTLSSILETYVPKGIIVDFLSVDVEGLDYDVLSTNDWDRFRPRYVLVESLESDFDKILDCPIYKLLKNAGYRVYAKSVNTYIYECISVKGNI